MAEKYSLLRRILLGSSLIVALLLMLFAVFDYYYTGFRVPLPCGIRKSTSNSEILFNFTVTSDIQLGGNPVYVFKKIKETVGGGAFHITTGDMLPVERTYKAVVEVFGEDFRWYPCQGNHDHRYSHDVAFSHNYFDEKLKGRVRPGPGGSEKTTYSFDYKNAHFIILNLYFDGRDEFGTDGDVVDELYNWLVKDLEDNERPLVFVFGHEPAFPFHRHRYDSLNKYKANRDRFWNLLEEKGVIAYFAGHTQVPSVYQEREGGTYQICLGGAQGDRRNRNDGFVNVVVRGDEVEFQIYANRNRDGEYILLDNHFYKFRNRASSEP